MLVAITNTTDVKTVLSFLTKPHKNEETLTVQVLGTESLTYNDCQQIQLIIKGQFPDAKVEILTSTDSKALMLLGAVKIENRRIDIESVITLDTNLINKPNELNLLISVICRKGVSKLTGDDLKALIASGNSLKIEDLKKLGLCKITFGEKLNRKKSSGKRKRTSDLKQTSVMNQTSDQQPDEGKGSDSSAQEAKSEVSTTNPPATTDNDKPAVKSEKPKRSIKSAVLKKEKN